MTAKFIQPKITNHFPIKSHHSTQPNADTTFGHASHEIDPHRTF
jgi:hypothetical protein